MEKERLVTFTDAVLAIIMTILVLELKKPTEPTLAQLWALRESFLAYALSFFWLGSMWIALHNTWSKANTISTIVIGWNIVLLFLLSLIPYTTSLVSIYYDNKVIQGLYGVVVILISIVNMIAMFYKKNIKQSQRLVSEYRIQVAPDFAPMKLPKTRGNHRASKAGFQLPTPLTR